MFFACLLQGFTYPVRVHFLEDILENTGYKLTSFNQVDDYGQDKLWKTQRQLVPRKKKNQISTLVEVCSSYKKLDASLFHLSEVLMHSVYVSFPV